LIQPKLGNIKFLEFHRAEETIVEGYREAVKQLKERWKGAVKKKLPKDSLSGRTKNGN